MAVSDGRPSMAESVTVNSHSQQAPIEEEPKLNVASILQAELAKAESEAAAIKPKTETTTVTESPIANRPSAIGYQPQSMDMTWEGFLTYLNSKSPASASNLEQGNITSPLRLENGELSVELGFGFSGMVFFDYLSDSEVHQKVVNHLAEYFNVPAKSVRLNLIEVQSNENFVSTAAIKEQLAEISMQEKIENFKNNPLLKEAEKIFNAKVDKVIIDNNKK
jgi:DNA polymerase-3 subunit gamma/tau